MSVQLAKVKQSFKKLFINGKSFSALAGATIQVNFKDDAEIALMSNYLEVEAPKVASPKEKTKEPKEPVKTDA